MSYKARQIYYSFLTGGILMIFLAGFGFAHESKMLVKSFVLLLLGVVVTVMPLVATIRQLADLEAKNINEKS